MDEQQQICLRTTKHFDWYQTTNEPERNSNKPELPTMGVESLVQLGFAMRSVDGAEW